MSWDDEGPDDDGAERAMHELIGNLVSTSGSMIVDAASYHENRVHGGEACPGNRLELLAYIAFRLSVPADAFEDEEARAIFREEVLDRDACYAEHVLQEDDDE